MKIWSFTVLMLGSFIGQVGAQILDPVDWRVSGVMISPQTAILRFEAAIDPGWYVYSQYLESDDGPVRTSIVYDSGVDPLNEAKESGGKKEGHDEMFDMTVVKFAKKYIIEQEISAAAGQRINGYIEYMSCDDTRCLPPGQEDFDIIIQPLPATSGQGTGNVEDGSIEGSDPKVKSEIGSDNDEATEIGTIEIPENIELNPGMTDVLGSRKEVDEPVLWTCAFQEEYLVIQANIMDGWKIYSSDQEIENFSIQPVVLTMANVVDLTYKERTSKRKVIEDANFGERLAIVEGEVNYRIPLDQLPSSGAITVDYMACDAEKCIFPEPVSIEYDKDQRAARVGIGTDAMDKTSVVLGDELEVLYGIPKPVQDDMDDSCIIKSEVSNINKKSFLDVFLLGLFGGFLALLTPCVFPMVPLTVSFFTKKHEKGSQESKKGVIQAIIYGLFILLIYLLLSIPFHFLDTINPDILNNISTNVFLNIVFFLVLIVFAFSFMGFFEISLPSSWTNKVSQAEGSKGLLGIFFMALTLCLVSFSCTGPILGTLLAGALTSEGGAAQLTAGLGGFGLALALPFALFAAIPRLMNKLPRSGGWMTTMKVVLGFLELALAFKFLSNADLVKQWGLLKYELFMVIWIICALGLAAYLFNLIRFPHDNPDRKLGVGKILGGFMSLAFAIYLIIGLIPSKTFNTYPSLDLLSGLAPPTGYSYFFPAHCPNGLSCFNDLSTGMEYAQNQDKPVLLDFTGYACVNCRKMEEHVWPDKDILNKLRDDYVLISLYVDDKTDLEEAIEVSRVNGEGVRTLRQKGELWQHLQTAYFNNNSQPYYVLLSPDGQVLNEPVGYTPDAKRYKEFLDCGLDALRDRRLIGSMVR